MKLISVLPFLIMELPAYPITKFVVAVMPGLAGIWWIVLRLVPRNAALGNLRLL